MLKDWIFKLERRRYRKAFEDWFGSGNRVLWVEDMLFILITVTITGQHLSPIHFWACDSEGRNFYRSGFCDIATFGEMINKKAITERIWEKMRPTSEETFIEYLNHYAKMAGEKPWIMKYWFSFDSINLNQFPDWLITKLAEHKLSE